MSRKHKVIFVPGLGEKVKPLEWALNNYWRGQGLDPATHLVGWHDDEKSFKPKLQRLIKMIDDFKKDGYAVSLVGMSAGGSAVINAFISRKNEIHKVINVCGRLKVGQTDGFRSFASKTKSSPAFAESIQTCEKNLKNLTSRDIKKIMTVRALFGDELVPSNTTTILGAHNIVVPTPEHMLSISAAMTLFSRPLVNFLKSS